MRVWAARLLVGALLVTLVYVGLAFLADVRDLTNALRQLDSRALLLATTLVISGYALRALRWRLYLHRVGAFAPAGREALGFAAGFTMGMASGKVGQVVKAYYLQLATGVPYAVSIPATFAERMADLSSVVLLLLVGLALAPGVDLRAPAAILALVLLFTLVMRSQGAMRALLRPARRVAWVARHEESFLAGHERLRAHLRPRDLAAPAFVGLAAYLLEAVALQALVAGFGVPLGLGTCIVILALADLAGVVSLLPGGLGAAEAGFLVLLTLQGLPFATATATTILFRLCTLWLGVTLGAIAALVLEWMHRAARARDRVAQG